MSAVAPIVADAGQKPKSSISALAMPSCPAWWGCAGSGAESEGSR